MMVAKNKVTFFILPPTFLTFIEIIPQRIYKLTFQQLLLEDMLIFFVPFILPASFQLTKKG
nr:hypothetical protein BAU18_05705 [Enterococcus diestrammenae]